MTELQSVIEAVASGGLPPEVFWSDYCGVVPRTDPLHFGWGWIAENKRWPLASIKYEGCAMWEINGNVVPGSAEEVAFLAAKRHRITIMQIYDMEAGEDKEHTASDGSGILLIYHPSFEAALVDAAKAVVRQMVRTLVRRVKLELISHDEFLRMISHFPDAPWLNKTDYIDNTMRMLGPGITWKSD